MSGHRLVELRQCDGKRVAINPTCVQAVFETIFPYAEPRDKERACVGLMMMFGGATWAPVYYIDATYDEAARALGLP